MKAFERPRAVFWPILTIFTLLLAACGGGGGGGSGSGGPPPPPPPPPAAGALIPAGMPVLIFRGSQAVMDQFDTIFEDIYMVVPDTGEVTSIFANQSTSGARSDIQAFTFEDRLMVLRNSSSGGLGSADWSEVDVAAPTAKSNGELADPLPVATNAFTTTGNSRLRCVAAVGSTLYWRSSEVGGGLRSVDLGTAGRVDGDLLIPATDNENCFSSLESADGAPGPAARVGGMSVANGVWHDVSFDADTGTMDFHTRDAVTGRPTSIATFTPADHAQYNRAYSFSVADGMAYWVRVHAGNQQIELWCYEFVGQPQLLLAGTVSGINVGVVSQLDVDDGYASFVIGSDFLESNNVVLFDPTTSGATVLDLFDFVPPIGGQLPPTFSNIQVMYR